MLSNPLEVRSTGLINVACYIEIGAQGGLWLELTRDVTKETARSGLGDARWLC